MKSNRIIGKLRRPVLLSYAGLILFMAIGVSTPALAQPPVVNSVYTATPPTIDGVMSAGEWDAVTPVSFVTDGGIPGDLYVMNDGINIYLAVIMPEDELSFSPNPDYMHFYFDNDNDAGSTTPYDPPEPGDDIFGWGHDINNPPGYEGFNDAHSRGSWAIYDDEEETPTPGTLDGTAAVTNDGTYNYYEVSHPLDTTDDAYDFSLAPGDTVGMQIRPSVDGGDAGYWPTHTAAAWVGWAQVVLAGPPTITTLPAEDITCNSAVIKATVNPNGGAILSEGWEYDSSVGGASGTAIYPPGGGPSGNTPYEVDFTLNGLSPDMLYDSRLYASNGLGTSYGVWLTFTTLPELDTDGICDDDDNCPTVDNPSQADTDSDGVGDDCDNCPTYPNTGQEDVDGDTYGDPCDNCPDIANDSQADSDGDYHGDACDPVDPNIPGIDATSVLVGSYYAQVCGDFETNPDPNLGTTPFYTIDPALFVVLECKDEGGNILKPMYTEKDVNIKLESEGPPPVWGGDVVQITPPEEICVDINLLDHFYLADLEGAGDISCSFTLQNVITDPERVYDPVNSLWTCKDRDGNGTVCVDLKRYAVTATLDIKDGGGGYRKTVAIDIKPGSDDNVINLGSNGNVPVAILSEEGFDACSLDPESITMADASVKMKGKGSKYMASCEDVNGDNRPDLVIHVETQGLSLDSSGVEAVLTGNTPIVEGQITIFVEGSDTVRVIHAD